MTLTSGQFEALILEVESPGRVPYFLGSGSLVGSADSAVEVSVPLSHERKMSTFQF